MNEKDFITQNLKVHQIQEYLSSQFFKAGYSHTVVQRTPLGEKVIIFTTRPGLVVGRKGDNIRKLTTHLKKRFKMENPQIEIGEVNNPMLDEHYVADKIAFNLERFGPKRFKSIGYRMLQEILNSGALGAEIVISGKVPSSRARTWRFSAGYLKKSGDISESFVRKCVAHVHLKAGTLGVKVSIMTPDIKLPDQITFIDQDIIVEETTEEVKKKPTKKEEAKEEKKVAKKTTKKTAKKAEAKEVKKAVKKETKEEKK